MRRLIRTYAHHSAHRRRPIEELPTRTMWVDPIPDGIAALAGHPVFQLAPLSDEIRAQMLHPDRQRRICKQARLTADGPPEILIWHPSYWHDRGVYELARTDADLFDVFRPQDFDNRFRRGHHWIGMTLDRVWTAGGGDRDLQVLGSYIHLVEHLDFGGNRRPAVLTGEIPEDDEGALGDLAR